MRSRRHGLKQWLKDFLDTPALRSLPQCLRSLTQSASRHRKELSNAAHTGDRFANHPPPISPKMVSPADQRMLLKRCSFHMQEVDCLSKSCPIATRRGSRPIGKCACLNFKMTHYRRSCPFVSSGNIDYRQQERPARRS